MKPLKTRLPALAAFLLCLSLTACRSPFVRTSIVNHTGSAVSLIEVDYPSASYGTQQIAANDTYHYRFQIQGPGPVKISYTGAGNKTYKAAGPDVDKGQEGSLTITLGPDGKVIWTPKLKAAKTVLGW
jgi:hypothetical protein